MPGGKPGTEWAKIIDAEGERQAAEKLVQAGAIMARQPESMQLRYLGTLANVAGERAPPSCFRCRTICSAPCVAACVRCRPTQINALEQVQSEVAEMGGSMALSPRTGATVGARTFRGRRNN